MDFGDTRERSRLRREGLAKFDSSHSGTTITMTRTHQIAPKTMPAIFEPENRSFMGMSGAKDELTVLRAKRAGIVCLGWPLPRQQSLREIHGSAFIRAW